MSYATDHAGAFLDVTAAGAAVTFSKQVRTVDPLTGQSTVAETTVVGVATRVAGQPRQYEQLKLIETDAVTLLFVPTTYGESPEVGMEVTWGGVVYTVQAVQPLEPDGTDILAKVVVSR